MFPNRRNTGNICSISVCSRPTRKLLYTDKLVEENAKWDNGIPPGDNGTEWQ